MFQAIIEDRNAPKVEKTIDGYSGFLFYDDNGMPLVAMHWQHRFNRMYLRAEEYQMKNLDRIATIVLNKYLGQTMKILSRLQQVRKMRKK